MKRDDIEFQDRSTPVAYFITIHTYGTWLHGDERGSMDRREYNRYGEARIERRPEMEFLERRLMKAPQYSLDAEAREAVEAAFREVCDVRGFRLFAIDIRTNTSTWSYRHPANQNRL